MSAGQPYELYAFARKHGLTVDRARTIIEKHGNDRPRSDEAAKEFLATEIPVMRPIVS